MGVSNILVYLLPPPHISGHHTKEGMQVMQEDESKARDAAALWEESDREETYCKPACGNFAACDEINFK